MSVPIDITDDTLASSLVPVQCASLAPPAEIRSFTCVQMETTWKKPRNRSFTSVQMFHTHTPQSGDKMFFRQEETASIQAKFYVKDGVDERRTGELLNLVRSKCNDSRSDCESSVAGQDDSLTTS